MFTESSSTAPVPVNETTTGTPLPTSVRFTKSSSAWSAIVGVDDGAFGGSVSNVNSSASLRPLGLPASSVILALMDFAPSSPRSA